MTCCSKTRTEPLYFGRFAPQWTQTQCDAIEPYDATDFPTDGTLPSTRTTDRALGWMQVLTKVSSDRVHAMSLFRGCSLGAPEPARSKVRRSQS